MVKKVLIFTKRVLPRSNTFVAAQGIKLPNYSAIFIGLREDTSGIALIDEHRTCVQQDHELFPFASRLMLDYFQHLTLGWKSALKNCSGSLLHAHFGKGGYYCIPISKQLDQPLVTTFHGSDITQKDRFSYNEQHRKKVFKESSKIIAVSKFVESKLIAAGCPENKIVQLYTGVDVEYFSPSEAKSEQPSVLFVGRFIEQKGCVHLLNAMKRVQKRMPDVTLDIAGYGKQEDKLKALASGMNNVTFIGALNRAQVKQKLASSWITCVPSIRMDRGNEESFSMITAESQSMGTPVVAFDTGGVKEALEDGVTGLLSREKNIDELADNLLALLQSDALRRQYSLAGIERTNRLFNIKSQCQKLEEVYNSVIC